MSGWCFGNAVGGHSCLASSDAHCTLPPPYNWRCPASSSSEYVLVKLEFIGSGPSLCILVKELPPATPLCGPVVIRSSPPGLTLQKSPRYSTRPRQKRYEPSNTGLPKYISLVDPTRCKTDLCPSDDALPQTVFAQQETIYKQQEVIAMLWKTLHPHALPFPSMPLDTQQDMIALLWKSIQPPAFPVPSTPLDKKPVCLSTPQDSCNHVSEDTNVQFGDVKMRGSGSSPLHLA